MIAIMRTKQTIHKINYMKRRLLLLITLLVNYGYAQTECPLDEVKFSGTVTTTSVGGAKIKASDATSNYRFGERVAIDGNIAAVASRSNAAAAGKVYIFTNDGSGNWSQQTILTASDGFAGDNFGSDVALEGNYLLVGARSQLDVNDVDTGAAYLFEYNGVNTWTEVARFEPSDGATDYRFGTSVAIEGNLILIGARKGCTGGCAYLYENDGTETFTYTETKLEPQVQSGYDGARFGETVVLKGGRAYVGGPYDYSSVGRASAGSVQIWDQANDGSWSRTHRLRGTETSEAFGWEMDVEGDYLAIGAMNFELSSTPEADQGRVFVYKADSNGDYLEANRVMIQNDDKDSFTDQRFGSAVALEDGFLYVGTWGAGNTNGDAVYIFKDDGTNNWTQIAKITSGSGWDEFSNRAVVVSYPNLLIGQNEDDSPSNSGAVHFIQLNNSVQPVASITGITEGYPSQSNGGIKVSFSDEATETQIKFSIDGGISYPYVFDDTIGNAEITNLAINTYDVWVAFDETSCPINLGSVDVNEIRYTTIPDTNFEAELESLGYDDISGDGQVPTAIIEVVTSLNVNNKNISDVTGIEDFRDLITLECESNNLTSLNISNNLSLETLNALNNQIAAIDISQNTGLKTINLGNNPITSLDVSNNNLITRLECDGTNITSLDISNLTQLDYLEAHNTSISVLDVSQNSVLRFANLGNTNLTVLDVSANIKLENLRLNNTLLTSLDLSTNTLLKSLRTWETNITELDLSNNTALAGFFGHNGVLEKLNLRNGNNAAIPNGGFSASGNPNLSCILVDDTTYSSTTWTNVDVTTSFSASYCEYTAIPDTNFEAALNALGYDDITNDGQVPTALIEAVTSLDVSNQNIADLTGIQDFVALVDLNVDTNALTSLDLSNNTNLQTLIFDNNSITNLNLGTISGLTSVEGRYNQLSTIDVSHNANLAFINLRDNLFTTVDVANNPLLETINLRACSNLTSIDISGNPNVKFLYFQDTALSDLDVSQNPLLEVVVVERVNFNAIDVSNLSLLRQLRISDNSFTHLDVSNNPALERLECENNDLTYLNLKNGNNSNMPNTDFIATGNLSLSCIIVDDPTWSAANWTNIDGTATFTNAFCRYTAIPDANFEAELEALGYDDISGDGQVPTAFIEVLSTLTVDNKNIDDLTGIQDFTALTYLNCRRNNLTTLDISQNVQLTYFNASQNDLTIVDLSNNVSLESLYLFSNDLTAIDLSNNTALKQLYIQVNTNLSNFDISNNTLLEEIDCSETNITALGTTNNTLLRTLEVYDSSLASLDLSTNTALELLRISNTSLTELNVSNNTALTEIRMDNTGIQTLDLSNQAGLTVLVADDGNLSSLNIQNGNNTNVASYLFDVRNNPNLTCVLVDDAAWSTTNWTLIDATTSFSDTYCRYTSIPDANFEAELEALGYDDISGDGQVPTVLIEDVTSLSIPNKGISDLTGIEDFIALKTLICNTNNLTSLDISQNLLLETLTANANDLATIDLSNNTALKSLNLGANAFTSLDVSNNTALTILSLQANGGLTAIDISNNVLLKQLRTYSTNIATLDVSSHPDLEMLRAYSSALTSIDVSNNLKLEELRVNGTNVTELDLSANTAITSLRVNDTGIETLDLTNQIVLQQLFAHDTSLNYLNVRNGNNINVGTFRIENNPSLSCVLVDDVAYSNTNWTSIDVGLTFSNTYCHYTTIPDPIFEARLEALGYDDISGDGQVPTALIEVVTNLYVPSSSLSDLTGIEDFLELETLTCSGSRLTNVDLSTNTQLRVVDFSNNDINTIDISNSLSLEELNLRGNNLSSIDVTNNVALLELDLSGSDISSIDLSNNKALTSLDLSNNDMTSLDLSNNTDLIELEINSLQITTLDLSHNTFLEELICSYTTLTNLDISNNVALTYLECEESNQLTSLDLSNLPLLDEVILNDNALLSALNIKNGNNTNIATFEAEGVSNLTCILVDDATYCTTNWTDIDGIASFSDTYCRYTTIPDANFEASLEALGFDDISGDGQVPTVLIEVVTSLNINNKSITDITGIEDFTALEVLKCSENTLGTLDVSNNINLEELEANACSLTSINLNHVSLLKKLSADSNLLTTIDISNNLALESLTLYGNQISTIDVKNNTALKVFDLFQNKLVILDLTNNIALEKVFVENNELVSLNIKNGNNTNITDFNASNNSDLYCVQVDDEMYSTTNWINVDVQTNFGIDCSVIPVVILNGANPQIIELGDGYTELGATTDDGSAVSIDTSEFIDAVGDYTIYYDATNAFGNAAVQVTRTVNVVDNTAPVITLNGANPQIIELGAGYTELGATTDDGSELMINDSEFIDAVGTYTIYYDATDAAGNTAVQVTRTVDVIDTTAPLITLNGANPQIIELGAGYTELGATTDDGSAVNINASEFMDAVGSYTIYYDATDASGNTAVQVTRTVGVVDTTAPVITLHGDNPQTIELGAGYIELGATTDDGSELMINDSEFIDAVGTYTIYYDATDIAGNAATQVTRTVNVVGLLNETENTFDEVVLSPNPASDWFQISGVSVNTELFIYNLRGRLLKQILVNENETIDIQELSVGVYLVTVISGTTNKTFKMVKD